MPQIITLSHVNAPKEQRQPNHPRSALLWPVLLYVKQCAGDKVDLVMLAHHPAAWKTHKRKHVCVHGHAPTHAHTHTHTHKATHMLSPLISHMLLPSFLSFSPPHQRTYSSVRGPHVCQSFIQTQLRLLHATIITRWTRGKHIKSAFSLAHCAPSCEPRRWRERERN